MHDPTVGPVRAVRAGAVVAAILTPTLAAHALGGGHLSWPGIVIVGALLCPLAAFVTARQLRLQLLGPLLGGAQALAHVLLAWLTPAGAMPCHLGSSPISSMHSVMHSWMPSMQPLTVACPDGPGVMPTHSSTGMLATHLVALMLTAVLLAHGESVLWRAIDALARLARRARPSGVRPRALLARPGHALTVRLAHEVVGGIGSVRGPPARVTA